LSINPFGGGKNDGKHNEGHDLLCFTPRVLCRPCRCSVLILYRIDIILEIGVCHFPLYLQSWLGW
jgi:hypothetical protein